MKPWSNPHTVAVLWLLAGVLLIGWLSGLVSLRTERLQWSHMEQTRTHHEKCPAVNRGAWCQ